jgi:hypothetical protein
VSLAAGWRAIEPRLGWLTLAAGLGVVLATAWVLRHTYGGDPSIYLPYARNIADGHLFQYNLGEFSSGSTSPLWALLLAPAYLTGLNVAGAKAIAAVVTALAIVLTVFCARLASGSLLAAALAGFYAITTLTLGGLEMFESGLIVCLVAGTVILGDRVVRRDPSRALSPRDVWPLAIVWAALPLARPESAVLVPLEVIALWRLGLGGHARELWRLALAAGAAALPSLAYYGYSLAELGVPSTSMQGRAFQFREIADDRLGPLYLSSDALDFLTSRPFVWSVVIAVPGLALLWRERSWMAAYAAAGFATYVALLTFVTPGSYDTGRYLLPAAPFIVIGGAVSLAAVTRRRVAAVTAITCALALLLLVKPAVDASIGDARTLRTRPFDFDTIVHRDAVDRVNRLAAAGDVVLAYEVQARYFLRGDLDILSLDGITDGKVAPYAERGDMRGFLLRYRPRWWILDTSTDPPISGVSGRPYLVRSVLGTAARRFIEHPTLGSTAVGGIRFAVVTRRPNLPYRFGAWRMVVRLDYPGAPTQ